MDVNEGHKGGKYAFLIFPLYISFRAKPPPISCSSLLANIPLKSAASPAIFGASPLLGALGLATLLLFSCPAFEGKVGNIAVDLGRGSSLKYGWPSTSLALGLCAGLSESREVKRAAPAFVRSGNLARSTAPVVCEVLGKRSDRAFGRRLKPGQVASVGIPQASKIWGLGAGN